MANQHLNILKNESQKICLGKDEPQHTHATYKDPRIIQNFWSKFYEKPDSISSKYFYLFILSVTIICLLYFDDN